MELARATVSESALAARVPSMQLCAETIGCRVPRTVQDGSVAAVFERACNVALAGGGMITVLVQNVGNVPHGVRLTCSPRLDRTLRTRMPVRLSRDQIVFDGGSIVLVLNGASLWTPPLQPGLCHWDARAVRAWAVAECLLQARAATSSSELLRAVLGIDLVDTPLAARAKELLPALSRSLLTCDPAASMACLAGLIGLGPGLTPAGDDFVIGWLAGLTLTALTREQLRFLHAVCDGMALYQSKTTLVSWQHLDDARALMFSERLAELCVAIATGAPAQVLAARLDAQLAVGASSGADAAAGLLFALREARENVQAFTSTPTY